MKICVVGYALLHKRQYSTFQHMKDHKIHFIVPKKWSGLTNEEFNPGPNVTVHYSRILLNGRTGKYLLIDTEKILESIKTEIIYTDEEPWSFTCGYTQRLAKKMDIPHVFFSWENLEIGHGLVHGKIEKYCCKNASGIVAGNLEAKERLRKRGATCPIEVMPPSGIDLDFFKPEVKDLRKELGLQNKKVVLYCGRLIKEKGIYDLLNCVESVVSQVPSAHFLIVGRGPEFRPIKSWIEKKGTESVTILEWIEYKKMPALYNTADVFVYPSRKTEKWKEQFGFALIEGMACGVPVISTKTGAIPEVAGDAAILTGERNTEKLIEATLQTLLDNNFRKDLIKKGRKRARVYGLEKIAKRHIQFFELVRGVSEHGL